MDITCSIVTYQDEPEVVRQAIDSFQRVKASKRLFVIDNSPNENLKAFLKPDADEIVYIKTEKNLGFGKAHNIALRRAVDESKYHLVLNPDVSFAEGTLEKLIDYLERNPAVGLVIPKVLDSQSFIQYACRRLPTPWVLIIRRMRSEFLTKLFDRPLSRYNMRDKDYALSFEAPSLSGCFMLIRTAALQKVGYFDERFFLYMEDVDLTRRIHQHFKTGYFPDAQILHIHARKSYEWNYQLIIHIKSAIKYFNKWGWFFDRERDMLNRN
jgi:GT2 family glycosyltransferase